MERGWKVKNKLWGDKCIAEILCLFCVHTACKCCRTRARLSVHERTFKPGVEGLFVSTGDF